MKRPAITHGSWSVEQGLQPFVGEAAHVLVEQDQGREAAEPIA